MPVVSFGAKAKRLAMAAALGGAGLALVSLSPSSLRAEGATREIVFTIKKIKPLDAWDELSKGDPYVRVTVGSTVAVSPVEKNDKSEFRPGWKLSAKVPQGVHKVKLELIDKDLTADDPVDVNRVDNKRDLDFTVDTKTCKIEGFSSTYKCGSSISRAGKETKKGDITFTVSVK